MSKPVSAPGLTEAAPSASKFMRMREKSHLREARIKYWRTLIVTAFFVVIVGFNIILAGIAVFGGAKKDEQSDAGNQAVHAARVTRRMLDGTFCRTMVIDSTSAKMIDDRIVLCERVLEKHKPSLGFTWGG
jgi:hypothetical protein